MRGEKNRTLWKDLGDGVQSCLAHEAGAERLGNGGLGKIDVCSVGLQVGVFGVSLVTLATRPRTLFGDSVVIVGYDNCGLALGSGVGLGVV